MAMPTPETKLLQGTLDMLILEGLPSWKYFRRPKSLTRTLQIINNAPYFRFSFLADFLLRNV
jgi:hypothetical protein